MKTRILIGIVLLLVGIIISVSWIRKLAAGRMKSPVAREQIIGTWYITPESQKTLVSLGFPTADLAARHNEIHLQADGRAKVELLIVHSGPTGLERVSAVGSWSLAAEQQSRGFKNVVELSLDHRLSSYKLFVREEDGRLFLWTYIEDPDDLWERYEFSKMPGAADISNGPAD